MNISEMVTNLSKCLLRGEKAGEGSVLLRYPALNQQWLCLLSFVGLRIVSLEVKKRKKEKKARVFLKSPYSTQPTKRSLPLSSFRREAAEQQSFLPALGLGRNLLLLGRALDRSALCIGSLFADRSLHGVLPGC